MIFIKLLGFTSHVLQRILVCAFTLSISHNFQIHVLGISRLLKKKCSTLKQKEIPMANTNNYPSFFLLSEHKHVTPNTMVNLSQN